MIRRAFLAGVVGVTQSPPAYASNNDSTAAVRCAIARAAVKHGVDAGHLERIAWCESKWQPGAFNPASGAAGLFQFIPQTWEWAQHRAGFEGFTPYDVQVASMAAAWLLSQPGGWRHWACR